MDRDAVSVVVAEAWRDEIVAELERYVAVPALSPAFDADWELSGHIEEAVRFVSAGIESRPVARMSLEVQRLPGCTPLIVVEVEPFGDGATDPDGESTVVLYGHVDKQPPMSGWRDGIGPWKPVREGERLYGRGAADDGYAAFAGLAAIEAVQASGGSHGRCLVLIQSASPPVGSVNSVATVISPLQDPRSTSIRSDVQVGFIRSRRSPRGSQVRTGCVVVEGVRVEELPAPEEGLMKRERIEVRVGAVPSGDPLGVVQAEQGQGRIHHSSVPLCGAIERSTRSTCLPATRVSDPGERPGCRIDPRAPRQVALPVGDTPTRSANSVAFQRRSRRASRTRAPSIRSASTVTGNSPVASVMTSV